MYKTLVTMLSMTAVVSPGLAEGTYWRCMAYDGEHKQWIVDSGYEITAINKAFDECKKQSKIPSSCKTAKEACEVFVNGVSTRPLWRCTALDQRAKAWPSSLYAHRDDAAFAAKAFCQEMSTFPDTCYVNLITCRNLNSRE